MPSSLPAAAPRPDTPRDQVDDMMVAITDLVFYDPFQARRDASRSEEEASRSFRLDEPETWENLLKPRPSHRIPPRTMWLDPIFVRGRITHLIIGIPRVPPRFPTLRPGGRALPPHIFVINLDAQDNGICLGILGEPSMPKVVFDTEVATPLLRSQHGIKLQGAVGLKQLWNMAGRAAGQSVQPAACNAGGVGKYLSASERPRWEECVRETDQLCNPSEGGSLQMLDQWPLPRCVRVYGSFVVYGMRVQDQLCRRILSAPTRDLYRHPLAAEESETARRRRREALQNQRR